MFKNEEEEGFDEDPNIEALPGGPPTLNQGHAGADLTLQLISAVAQLHVLLQELDDDEFKAAQPRLRTFRRLVRGLPKRPGSRRILGFR